MASVLPAGIRVVDDRAEQERRGQADDGGGGDDRRLSPNDRAHLARILRQLRD